ncbi:hypothetical protein [Desulfurella sp.]|uniref:hypothetical protein n=1 Tax=Desulfurella sp. TaxID=1962857 RepID=UPI0025BF17CD|nr:hypothetical protein [Desulfurella sp.]
MDLDAFHKTLIDLINSFASKLPQGAVIAMLMQPTQWNAPDKKFYRPRNKNNQWCKL